MNSALVEGSTVGSSKVLAAEVSPVNDNQLVNCDDDGDGDGKTNEGETNIILIVVGAVVGSLVLSNFEK